MTATVDPQLLRGAALSLRTMAAMLPATTVRDSALFHAYRLSLKAAELESEAPTHDSFVSLTGNRDHD
jgi:hypothetical protein